MKGTPARHAVTCWSRASDHVTMSSRDHVTGAADKSMFTWPSTRGSVELRNVTIMFLWPASFCLRPFIFSVFCTQAITGGIMRSRQFVGWFAHSFVTIVVISRKIQVGFFA